MKKYGNHLGLKKIVFHIVKTINNNYKVYQMDYEYYETCTIRIGVWSKIQSTMMKDTRINVSSKIRLIAINILLDDVFQIENQIHINIKINL